MCKQIEFVGFAVGNFNWEIFQVWIVWIVYSLDLFYNTNHAKELAKLKKAGKGAITKGSVYFSQVLLKILRIHPYL